MGTRLGRYVMLKHLATGGMADVLLGRSDGIEGFERYVVLKRIRPEYAKDQQFIRMFLDEARVAATLHHQHIVQVHDIGESDGEYFIAMEYLHGEDVRTLLSNASKSRTHVALGFAVAIISAVAGGLHYAHERLGNDKRPLNIVHRDVSPSNIFIGYDGSIKIVDFGIAKASMREETRSGNLKGKLAYMSPEQCTGGEVDRRSDVYALGVVLYELATTSRMFKGENDYLVMEQIVKGRVTPPLVRRPNLPPELAEIIMRAVAPDPANRYATADELRIALDQFAVKAALIASSSTIAAYMRKKFGQRPEPWLDLPGVPDGSLDEVRTLIGEPLPNHSWTEMPRVDGENVRASNRHGRSTPTTTGPVNVITNEIALDGFMRDGAQAPLLTARPSLPQPTGSKMGWESQRPETMLHRVPVQKIAIGLGLLALCAVMWRLANGGTAPEPVVGFTPGTRPPPVLAAVVPAPAPPPVSAPATGMAGNIAIAPASEQPVTTRSPPGRSPRSEADDRAGRPRPAGTTTPTRREPRLTVEATPSPGPRPAAPTPAPSHAIEASPPQEELHPVLAPVPAPPVPLVPQPPLPAAPAPPPAIAASVLDANRISGDKRIVPDENTMAFIGRAGTEQVASAYKVCVTAEGTIGAVTQLKSTGFPAYDARILATIRGEWRYRPFLINGKPSPVCTGYRFIYRQK